MTLSDLISKSNIHPENPLCNGKSCGSSEKFLEGWPPTIHQLEHYQSILFLTYEQ